MKAQAGLQYLLAGHLLVKHQAQAIPHIGAKCPAKVYRVSKVSKVFKVSRVYRVDRVYRVYRVSRVYRVYRVSKVFKVFKVLV
jgi:hypothetical protein